MKGKPDIQYKVVVDNRYCQSHSPLLINTDNLTTFYHILFFAICYKLLSPLSSKEDVDDLMHWLLIICIIELYTVHNSAPIL